MDVSEPGYATLALLWMVRPLLLRYRQGHSDDSIIVRPLATAIQCRPETSNHLGKSANWTRIMRVRSTPGFSIECYDRI